MRTSCILIVLVWLLCVTIALSQTNYYIDPMTGNDSWDGLSPTYSSGSHGPKATLQTTVNTASTHDILHLAVGQYNESVTVGKSLAMECMGISAIQDLDIRNCSEVSLNGFIVITGNLSLSSRLITCGSTSALFVTSPNASALRINDGSINGRILRTIAANSAEAYRFTDPYTMLIPDGTQGTTVVSVLSLQGQKPPNITGQAISRYYHLTAFGHIQGTLQLAYFESELDGILEDNLTSFRWNHDATSWDEAGGTVHTTENYFEIPAVILDCWSKWALGERTDPLPIQLACFSAFVSNGNDVQVNWRTLTETNNFGFYIQRRNSPSNEYVEVPNSFVPGHGTTIEPHDYTWTHQDVSPGTYFYRLKQVDLDGTVNFSEGRQVEVFSPTDVTETYAPVIFGLTQNHPNPFNPSTRINFTVDKPGYTTLVVFDVLGKEVGRLYSGVAEAGKLYSMTFDASHLTNGTYLCRLVNGAQTSLKKMVLLK